jgi:hypothetical protein
MESHPKESVFDVRPCKRKADEPDDDKLIEDIGIETGTLEKLGHHASLPPGLSSCDLLGCQWQFGTSLDSFIPGRASRSVNIAVSVFV